MSELSARQWLRVVLCCSLPILLVLSRCRSRMWKPLTFGWQCAFSLSSLPCWSMRPSTSLHANTRSCCASRGGEGILRWALRSKHTSSISPDPLWWIFTVLGIQPFNVLMVAFGVTEYSKYFIRASKSRVYRKIAWCHIQGFQNLAFNSALLRMKIKITIWIYKYTSQTSVFNRDA